MEEQLAAYAADSLMQAKLDEENKLSKAEADAARRHFTIIFDGKGPTLQLESVSLSARKSILFTQEFADDDRLTDLLLLIRSKIGLKTNESVALTHISTTTDDGKRLRRPLPCFEYNEEVDAGLGGMGEEENMSVASEKPSYVGLNPETSLREVGLFRDNVTVNFDIKQELAFKFPPFFSTPKLVMPKAEQIKHLRERLKERRRFHDKYHSTEGT